MTFFANSGIVFPGLERASQDAGTKALRAGSQFWDLVAHLEAGSERHDSIRQLARSCSEQLDEAAKVYGFVGDQVKHPPFSVTGSDLATAAVTDSPLWLYRLYLRDHGPSLDISDLYRELRARITRLSEALRGLDVDQLERSQLAPHIFAMMEDWEIIAKLARLIATLTRKKDAG